MTSSTGSLGSGTYVYDSNGLRVEKTSGGATTVYVFSGSKIIAEYASGAAPSSLTREYIYSGRTLVAKVEGGTTNYYQQDALSVQLMTDAQGNKIGEQGHFPYGEQWYAKNATTKWFFANYERDTESNNDYALAREYVNRLGRFSALDPAAASSSDPQSLNRYPYVENDPINNTDPTGQDIYLDGADISVGMPWMMPGLSAGWDSLDILITQDLMTGAYGSNGPWYSTGTGENGQPAYFGPNGEQIYDSSNELGLPAIQNEVIIQGSLDGWWTMTDRVGGVIIKVLRSDNDCSKFFNNSPLVQANQPIAGMSFGPTTALGFYKSDTLEPDYSMPNQQGAGSNEGAGEGALIGINWNPSGAFLGGFARATGPFQTGSLGAQVTMVLHELAHTLMVIPPDGEAAEKAGFPASESNTDTVLKHCPKAIQAALKSIAY